MLSTHSTGLPSVATKSWSAPQRQELICFDCLSQALDYRESIVEQIGQHHSIIRLAKSLFGVAPLPLVQVLKAAGFTVMVR
ncbi:hypothetical protein ACFSUS_02610 [Spirosoma soli]|uniref:Uncharacterized protein n=1 Tax=Spirosoma soli TaxID=1770529 RepID=A0ABW5LXJ3_9BACT